MTEECVMPAERPDFDSLSLSLSLPVYCLGELLPPLHARGMFSSGA